MIRLSIRDASGQRDFSAERRELLVGRREGADLRIEDPATSRNHCLLRIEDGHVRLVDLGSSSGVRVNGAKVNEALLGPGAEFRIGNTRLTLVNYSGALADGPSLLEPVPAAAGRPAPAGRARTHGIHQPDFGAEIRAMVSATPWYTISLLLHIVILLLVHLLTDEVVTQFQPPAIQAEAKMDVPELDEALEMQVAEPDLADLEPEVPPEEDFLEPDDPSPRKQGDPTLDEFEERRAMEYSPVIGPRKSLTTRLQHPLSVPGRAKNEGESINRGDVEGEHRGAKDSVERGLGGGLRTLRRIGRDRIVVVRGDFDQIEKILELYEIPHTTITRARLRARSFPRMQMLCINCDQQPPPAQRKQLVEKVAKFVRNGGWLITSDWAVDPYLTKGFPRKVTGLVAKKRNQSDTTIIVRKETDSPLLRGVLDRRTVTRWWLEDASFMMRVDRRLVTVLMVSDDMAERYGGSVVAFTWRERKGRVLHLLGHFYQKDGNRRGLVAMQRLILNYLVERFPS